MRDGFAADDRGTPDDSLPSMRMELRFETTERGSRVTWVTHFSDLAAMERLADMGMVEGSRSAMGQLDTVVQEVARS